MAVRAPTSFVEYIDYDAIKPRRQVMVTEPNNALNDQQLMLTKVELAVSDAFRPNEIPVSQTTWFRVATYWVTFPDLCGTAATRAGVFSVRHKASGTEWDISLYNTATAARYQFTSRNTGLLFDWGGTAAFPSYCACTLATDGTENELRLEVQCPTGIGGPIWVAGLAVFV